MGPVAAAAPFRPRVTSFTPGEMGRPASAPPIAIAFYGKLPV